MDTDTKQKLDGTKDWLQKEFSSIRTGQATPALLDGIKIDNYGSLTPLSQVGTVGVEDARTLRVSLWDVSQIPLAEKAVTEADLGVSLSSDSAGLRVIFPELTAERRVQLLRLAKTKLEEARVTVRAVRDDAMKLIEKELKAGDISEDEKFTRKELVQSSVDTVNTALEALYDHKEQELNK